MKNKTHKEKDEIIKELESDVELWRHGYQRRGEELEKVTTEFAEFQESSFAERKRVDQENYSLTDRLKKCERELSATQQVVKIERGDRLKAYEKTLTIIEKLIEY